LDKINQEQSLVFDLGGGTFDVSILQLGEECSKSKPPLEIATSVEMTLITVLQWMISLS